jgi:uncharacterized glyoxalase superfamily protein PhnB
VSSFKGLTPYLYYDDAAAAADWLASVLGFEEIGRHKDSEGRVTNVEFRIGPCELWIDGYPGYWRARGGRADQWIGVWVDDVDAMYERIRQSGVACDPPADRPHGVREIKVEDPQGYAWGFMTRI